MRGNAGEEALSSQHPGCCSLSKTDRGLVSSPTQYAWRNCSMNRRFRLLSFLRNFAIGSIVDGKNSDGFFFLGFTKGFAPVQAGIFHKGNFPKGLWRPAFNRSDRDLFFRYDVLPRSYGIKVIAKNCRFYRAIFS